MNRLEIIREEILGSLGSLESVDHETVMGGVDELIQRLERYETAIQTISETKTHMQALYFAEKALKEDNEKA